MHGPGRGCAPARLARQISRQTAARSQEDQKPCLRNGGSAAVPENGLRRRRVLERFKELIGCGQ